MEVRESSEYVITKAKLLAEHFSARVWIVTAGKSNCILIYIPSGKPYQYTVDQFAQIIAESDFHVPETRLKLSDVTYMFFHQGTLIEKVEVLPGREFDIWD